MTKAFFFAVVGISSMGRLMLAWQILTNSGLADRVLKFLAASPPTALAEPPRTEKAAELDRPAVASPPVRTSAPTDRKVAARSDAVTLLSTLQREGRLIDFLKESIGNYTDAQVGAAVRDIHRDCAVVIERQFGIRPVLDLEEGAVVQLTPRPDAGRVRVSGAGAGLDAHSGRLVHHGWRITRSELPLWTGNAVSVDVVATAEVEVSVTGGD